MVGARGHAMKRLGKTILNYYIRENATRLDYVYLVAAGFAPYVFGFQNVRWFGLGWIFLLLNIH